MHRSFFLTALVSLLPAACASASPVQDANGRPACTPPSGWQAVADAAEGKILWIGELHGTAEGPSTVANYLCAAANRGGDTLLVLEFPADDSALTAGHASETPRETWLSSTHWRRFASDGRHSEAMLDLLLSVRRLRDAGISIDVYGFDITSEQIASADWSGPGTRDRLMAENLRRVISGYDRVLVLTGNIHAMEARSNAEIPYNTAAAYFEDEEGVSLKQTHDGGSAWHCRGQGDCRVYDGIASSRPYDDMQARPAVAIVDALEPHHDGYMHLGPVTASPPALTAQEE